jgi:dipeptidyl aminopeptidase/acylaminoacyl peptidase
MADDAIAHGSSRNYLLGPNPSVEVKELLSNEKHVTQQTPPAFIIHSISDGTVKILNSDLYVTALMQNNVPFEYLREPIGGHGFSLTQDWAYQAIAWLHAHKF